MSGGYSTPPPFTDTGAANTVIGSMPSGKKGWQAEVVSNQESSLTSYVYCAKRKRTLIVHSLAGEPSSVATIDGLGGICQYLRPPCPKGRVLPGGGGFSEQGPTTSQYLIPVTSHQQGEGTVWHSHALKVGSGVPVGLSAVLLCRSAQRERAAGRTLAAIAEALNDDKVPTPRGGKRWPPSSFSNLLRAKA